ncbi:MULTISPECIES: GNAT family protein [unclassified Rhodococcus (in: high G+C Gram-positive bacteria)]|uniref:GNAT family N-acetyltransferase n=1 Tax=unclassified Rhodococcus (in: high G+C Gram-positive bacteria) TaxID=192944 RepID=UPI00289ED92E|nr:MULTISPECIES: GNAT family protein [unclassified Rhodococcus (in: high G+C Gram-positive bacteria)]
MALRSPRLSDATAWREIRLRDQHLIEPYWVSSALSWPERHTETIWVDECLQSRKAARAGLSLPLVVEVDGRFAGQCNLERIDMRTKTAELGIWLDAQVTGRGVCAVVGALLADYAIDTLGLRRVTAPICVDNAPAAKRAQRMGMRREGTIASFLDVGGHRRDHDMWAITSDMWALTTTMKEPHHDIQH